VKLPGIHCVKEDYGRERSRKRHVFSLILFRSLSASYIYAFSQRDRIFDRFERIGYDNATSKSAIIGGECAA